MAGTKGGHRGRGDLPQMGVLGMFPMGDPTWSMCEGSELGGVSSWQQSPHGEEESGHTASPAA